MCNVMCKCSGHVCRRFSQTQECNASCLLFGSWSGLIVLFARVQWPQNTDSAQYFAVLQLTLHSVWSYFIIKKNIWLYFHKVHVVVRCSACHLDLVSPSTFFYPISPDLISRWQKTGSLCPQTRFDCENQYPPYLPNTVSHFKITLQDHAEWQQGISQGSGNEQGTCSSLTFPQVELSVLQADGPTKEAGLGNVSVHQRRKRWAAGDTRDKTEVQSQIQCSGAWIITWSVCVHNMFFSNKDFTFWVLCIIFVTLWIWLQFYQLFLSIESALFLRTPLPSVQIFTCEPLPLTDIISPVIDTPDVLL